MDGQIVTYKLITTLHITIFNELILNSFRKKRYAYGKNFRWLETNLLEKMQALDLKNASFGFKKCMIVSHLVMRVSQELKKYIYH